MVVRSVREITSLADTFAQTRSLRKTLEVKRGDEIGQLARAFDELLSEMRWVASLVDQIGRWDFRARIGMRGQLRKPVGQFHPRGEAEEDSYDPRRAVSSQGRDFSCGRMAGDRDHSGRPGSPDHRRSVA